MSDLYIKLDKEIVDYLWAGRSYLCENKSCQCHTECTEADKYIEEILKKAVDIQELVDKKIEFLNQSKK